MYLCAFTHNSFVHIALSNSFYWQSAWRSCQDGGIVAIQVLNRYIYIPTCNPSPMPKGFSTIRGRNHVTHIIRKLKDSLATWLKSFLVIALCCANEKLPSSRRLMLSYACVCVHTTAFHVFCSYVLRWPTNIYTTHKRRMSDVSERLGPSREFRSHQFVQVGEQPFWCSKSDRGGLHSRQSLRCLTTLKPQ